MHTTLLFPSLILALALPAAAAADARLEKVRLPPGFKIELYAGDVPGARSLALSPSGVVYVGTRQAGKVYAVIDRDLNGRAEEVVTLAEGLEMPNGVAFRKGSLYVAEVGRVLRYDKIERRLHDPPPPAVVNDKFPKDEHHGWKYLRFGPDDKLYVPVGAPCNVCKPENPIYATITRMNPDGSGLEIAAHGIRNTVGFDWHPETKELWFTDNGRDWLGDDLPPDELNRAPEKGMHFGYPYCHGPGIPDPKFGKERDCGEFTSPALNLGAHVAALGMRFYTGKAFPERYRNQIFIAEHGSWNRSEPAGYRVSLVRLKEGAAETVETFAEGWLEPNGPWGRPVDLLVLADGSLLLSDDHAGAIYRITYSP